MPIHDNNPERRNLMVASLCFIIFVLAGGHVNGNEVRLQVVNVVFDCPVVLVTFAWAMLFWFALRYWQLHKGKVKSTFIEEVKNTAHSKSVVAYVAFKTKKKHRELGGFHPRDFDYNGGKLKVRIGSVEGGNRSENGQWVNFRSNNYELINIEGIAGSLLMTWSCLKLSFTKPGVGSYFIPYFLFVFAVALGAIRVAL
jgi:hypothetical protein